MHRVHDERGQAAVELVALLPALALVCGLLWQAVVAGQALWLSAGAARVAARAAAVGGDTESAARSALPQGLRRSLSVDVHGDGSVTVGVRVPAVVGGGALGTVTATAAMPRQR